MPVGGIDAQRSLTEMLNVEAAQAAHADAEAVNEQVRVAEAQVSEPADGQPSALPAPKPAR